MDVDRITQREWASRISLAAFVALSGAVALGWLHGADLWALRTSQENPSRFLDYVAAVFSFLGSAETSVALLLALLIWLYLRGSQALAGRILVAFVVATLVELAMKLYLPQASLLEGSVRAADVSPFVAVELPYPYPSGHILRSGILFGSLFLLSRNRLLRAILLLALVGAAVGRVYQGVHWASDVVGGALLGLWALLWAFSGESKGSRPR